MTRLTLLFLLLASCGSASGQVPPPSYQLQVDQENSSGIGDTSLACSDPLASLVGGGCQCQSTGTLLASKPNRGTWFCACTGTTAPEINVYVLCAKITH